MSDLISVCGWFLAFFAAVAAAWFAWKALFPPDRRLELVTSQGPDGPQQTLVTITSRGKYGVAPEQFGTQPLTLTLAPPAQKVVSTDLSTGRSAMTCEAQDGKLIVNPGLIAADESLNILIETREAGPATITHHDHQMPEVKITKARSGREVHRRAKEKPSHPEILGAQLVISVAVGGISLAATIFATVSVFSPPPLSITPKPVAPGEMATVCGSKLHPFDTVELNLGYETGLDQSIRDKIASGQVDSKGDFCASFRIPMATKLGNSELSISVVDGGVTHFYSVNMSVAGK